MESEIIRRLEAHQLRKTAFRKEVLELFIAAKGVALSNQDLEGQLENPDRITLYRTLKAFEDKGLIHLAVDSGGVSRYALCSSDCTAHAHHDQHAHFHCLECGKTICLEGEVVIRAKAPEGYEVARENLVLEGTCAKCGAA
ncbi:transcriptional repressor [Phaeodactylibacter luteus]|uniref:Transcriptional repressor n=2 Tax=Phaeodactylibacter luteus TaxID=1564516 RepID=A0A5C6RRI4_9BACT|nr:transcriptional repressor [Phaeodactylibacter luteus]